MSDSPNQPARKQRQQAKTRPLSPKAIRRKKIRAELDELMRGISNAQLTTLNLLGQDLKTLPAALFNCTNLRSLTLTGNRVTRLPPEIGNLTKLEELIAYGCRLSTLPPEITHLQNLKKLGLSGNDLVEPPDSLYDLTSLEFLSLSANKPLRIGDGIGRLRALRELRLVACGLRELPNTIDGLKSVSKLKLAHNALESVPASISGMESLRTLDISANPITSLPIEMADCANLRDIKLTNPDEFRFPPSDIARLGSNALLAYLRAASKGSEEVWESKLLLVGEGAVGKTWLYEAMNGRLRGGRRASDGATIGIEIGAIKLQHPSIPNVEMTLNCWDFAGQDINHATHQFFFSDRTLFLLCWSARAGWESGKLRKWLTNIRDRAPNARVLLVSTQCDQPHSDFPERELLAEFPQIVGSFKTSSETGEGVEKLLCSVQEHSASLPMMGLRWPSSWRSAQQAITTLGKAKPYCDLSIVREAAKSFGLLDTDIPVLLRWLHELGEILHYADMPELASTIVLDPHWVTQRVGRVLASKGVQEARGVLTQAGLAEIWPDLDQGILQHLLGMMERFDLAYRIPDDVHHRCLVVERLPQNPPDYEARWRSASGSAEVRLRYKLRSLHPGIPTWFIARCHRFTLGLHWLRGVLFGDSRSSPRHLALVVANETERTVDFNVRGPRPWMFLPLLTDGFEDTISRRYPGLEYEKLAPCPGRRKDGTSCDFEFSVADLESLRWPTEEGTEPEYSIRCTRCRTTHSIDSLLLGLSHVTSRDSKVLDNILDAVRSEGALTREAVASNLLDVRKFVQLSFVQEWNKAQELLEQSCPTVFALFPIDGKTLTRTSTLRLQLYCMNPDCWHSIGSSGRCDFQPKRDWLLTMARWTRTSLKWIRPVAALLPSGSQLAGEYADDLKEFSDNAANEFKLTAEAFKQLKDIPEISRELRFDASDDAAPREWREGADLRELRQLLESLDFPVKEFGGLKRVRTPEGHVLWLCGEHANAYLKSLT